MRRVEPAADPLDLRVVLAAARRATEAVAHAENSDEALKGLCQALVPDVADVAEIFVIGSGGRLQPRTRAPTSGSGFAPSTGDSDGIDDPDHPATAAVRWAEPVGVSLDGRPVRWEEAFPGGRATDFRSGKSAEVTPALRGYGIGAQILAALGIHDMVLLSNTRHAPVGLSAYGLAIVEERCIAAKTCPTGADSGIIAR